MKTAFYLLLSLSPLLYPGPRALAQSQPGTIVLLNGTVIHGLIDAFEPETPPQYITISNDLKPGIYSAQEIRYFCLADGLRFISAYHFVARSSDSVYFDEDHVPRRRPPAVTSRRFFQLLVEGNTIDLLYRRDVQTHFLYSEKGDTAREMGTFLRADRLGGVLDGNKHFYKDALIFLAKKYGRGELAAGIEKLNYSRPDMITIFSELNDHRKAVTYKYAEKVIPPKPNHYIATGFGYTELIPVPPAKWLENSIEKACVALSVNYGRHFNIPHTRGKLKFQPEAGACFYWYDLGPHRTASGAILEVGVSPMLTYDPFPNGRVRPRLSGGVQFVKSISTYQNVRKVSEKRDFPAVLERKWRMQYQGRFTISTREIDFYLESVFANWTHFYNNKWANNMRFMLGMAMPLFLED